VNPNHLSPHDGQDQDYGRRRVVIENVTPEVVKGEFPIKREVGDLVVVEADIFVDGHDTIASALLYKKKAPLPGKRFQWSSFKTTPARELQG